MIRRKHWTVEILPSARRELLALRNPIQDRIRSAVRALADDPTPSDSIAMRGKGIGLYRLRVGRYRIVYRLKEERLSVLVIRVGHGSEVYKGWEPLH
jgi:mRNA interferase RelE/StbE